MKNYKYFYILFIFIILVILFLIYYKQNNKNKQENFTPYIRKIYKPHIRKIRIFSEGLYNNTVNKISTQIQKLKFF